ncbi:family 10 glycosylhydrolase [Pseudomonas typographi]|uniref:family 10 glycosylhydrolase n=1 Tax=Pseudomonas typographi TaxID=2715964 RepID=UPI001689383A|nr:family 10 glycosylhydrolase [Pseudomonas typographi]MBD1587958.1 family 10 glycosylhydrolase [Pseudomonas typographi]
MNQPRIILCNDGATLALPSASAELNAEAFVAATLGPLRGTAINTLYWQLGADPFHGSPSHRLSDWYTHATKIGPVWGADATRFQTATEWRLAATVRNLREAGTDAVALVVEHGHRAGLEVFVSLRINDGSDCRIPEGQEDAYLSSTRKSHPHWLLHGEGVPHPSLSQRQQQQSRFALNFSKSEVRDYTLALVAEAIDQYDLDGFDLDFCRQPSLFLPDDVVQGTGLIHEMLTLIRKRLDEKGARVGRRLALSVRVPADLEANRACGLDVARWIEARLVDIVVVADPKGWNYRLPLEAFLELTQGSDIQIVAQNLCGMREERPRSATVLFGEGSRYSTEQYRAVAANHWLAGAHGQFIWNQHLLPYIDDARFDAQAWRDIGDAATLAGLDKHYVVGAAGRGGPLPLELDQAGNAISLDFELADDFPMDGGPAVLLRILIEQLTDVDELRLSCNGIELDRGAAIARVNYNDYWLDFDLYAIARQGRNRLVIELLRRNPYVVAPLILRRVETLVSYGGM